MPVKKGDKRGPYNKSKKKTITLQNPEKKTPEAKLPETMNQAETQTLSLNGNNTDELNTVERKLNDAGLTPPALSTTEGVDTPKRSYKKREEREKREGFINVIKGIIPVVTDMLAIRMPNPIPASESEKQFMSEAIAPVIEKYLPENGEWNEELLAIGAIAAFTLPRMSGTKKAEAEKNEA